MPAWIIWLLIAMHINSAPASFDGREDFRLSQPAEYGFDAYGYCVEYTQYPTMEQMLHSVNIVEEGKIDPSVILYEDGYCANGL